ncbi:MAG TPA: hypothetical protein VFP65_24105 [Anaeromyxobacteraceae bacterium]|nr:hypothetical protein [Anaeromyxobacteraceae bacterium]
MARHVRGSLFVEYVRMLRAAKRVHWEERLSPADAAYLAARVEDATWYPMDTFERFGLAILETIARGDLEVVRAWGKVTAGSVARRRPELVTEGDPLESLARFHGARAGFFDFDAVRLAKLQDGEVRAELAFRMSPPAERAASYQTMGFFEGLLGLAGARDVAAEFLASAWQGDQATTLLLTWRPRARRP